MVDRDAAEFLTLYLRGDAMTWWRSYCSRNGGLTNVFANKSFNAANSFIMKFNIVLDHLPPFL